MTIIVRFGCIRMECRGFGMPMVRILEPGSAGTEAAQRQHSIQKNDTIIQMMGPREDRFLRHRPPRRPIQTHDQSTHIPIEWTASGDVVWFTLSSAIDFPPIAHVGDAIDLFGRPIFSYPRFPTAPPLFVPRFPPPPLSRGRHRPSLRCTPSRTCSRYVVRSHSEAGGSKRPSWLVGGRIIEPAVSFGTPNHWKGLRRPFLVQTSESQAVSWNIDFYPETKMNITSGPTMTRPFLVLSRQQKFEWHRQSINIFFVALLAAMN